MKYLPMLFGLIPLSALASNVPEFNIRAIVQWAVVLTVIAVVFGLLMWGVRSAPDEFLSPTAKKIIIWVLCVLLGLAVIWFLLSLL